MSQARGIYLHLAFCPYICPYCDFAKELWNDRRADRYLNALHTEIARGEAVPGSTLFLGGGTPNTYPAGRIVELVELARRRFALADAAEISIECNPDLRLCESFDAYRASGINRISFGVQSFVPEELKRLGRRHTGADAAEAVGRARRAGFRAISLDLMFGTPGQTLASLERSLDAALALDIPHLSAYGLTVEEGTPYETWRIREPEFFDDDGREAELYARIIDRLAAAGYEQYELSNFARPGARSMHNGQYWDNDEYLGFGMGAASYGDGIRRVNTKNYDAYVEALERDQTPPAESERLEPAARLGEAVMLALRRSEGVDAARFAERYACDVFATYRKPLARFRADGLLDVDARGFRLTRNGRFLANTVCAAFLTPVLI